LHICPRYCLPIRARESDTMYTDVLVHISGDRMPVQFVRHQTIKQITGFVLSISLFFLANRRGGGGACFLVFPLADKAYGPGYIQYYSNYAIEDSYFTNCKIMRLYQIIDGATPPPFSTHICKLEYGKCKHQESSNRNANTKYF
jgi:hypothetical protein